MKAKKTVKAPVAKAKKVGGDASRARKMEPLKSKELKNQHFDSDEEEEEPNPEAMADDFKDFEDIEALDDDDDDDDF